MKWWQWHILINTVMTLITFADQPNDWPMLPLVIPATILIYWIPAYIITLIIRWVRSFGKTPTPTA